ncbi:ABC transporter permease [Geomonas subterranea]|uniref:ABC transporter permease n=1 Tax=Geomonas subterranea TaxID=2847989 RepID=UPI001CD6DFAB|nr:ABC transporter permease [Geomonas fuzhouensis]
MGASASIKKLRHLLLRWSGVALFLLAWELAPRLEWVDPYFLPPFSTVVAEIDRLFTSAWLSVHILVSLWRALAGLLIAVLIGIPAGLLLGRVYPRIANAVSPLLKVLSQVNPFSLLPVFVLFFGIGEAAKLAVVAWVSVWPVLFYTMTGSRNVDTVQEKTAASMGIGPWALLVKVILPGALPTIFVGVRIAATVTFYILVAAEMLGASAGLGYLVHNAAMNYQIPRIYAGATFIVVFGFLLNRGLIALGDRLFCWQETEAVAPADGPAPSRPSWRPGRFSACAAAAATVVLLVLGGIEVGKVNREAASLTPGDHSRHFGTPVDSGSGS